MVIYGFFIHIICNSFRVNWFYYAAYNDVPKLLYLLLGHFTERLWSQDVFPSPSLF